MTTAWLTNQSFTWSFAPCKHYSLPSPPTPQDKWHINIKTQNKTKTKHKTPSGVTSNDRVHLQARQAAVTTITYNHSQVVISTSWLLFPAAVAWVPQAHHQMALSPPPGLKTDTGTKLTIFSSGMLLALLPAGTEQPAQCTWDGGMLCKGWDTQHITQTTALTTVLNGCQVRKLWDEMKVKHPCWPYRHQNSN